MLPVLEVRGGSELRLLRCPAPGAPKQEPGLWRANNQGLRRQWIGGLRIVVLLRFALSRLWTPHA
eukprot:12722842-Alexandrium_andersonii.AAC.1